MMPKVNAPIHTYKNEAIYYQIKINNNGHKTFGNFYSGKEASYRYLELNLKSSSSFFSICLKFKELEMDIKTAIYSNNYNNLNLNQIKT